MKIASLYLGRFKEGSVVISNAFDAAEFLKELQEKYKTYQEKDTQKEWNKINKLFDEHNIDGCLYDGWMGCSGTILALKKMTEREGEANPPMFSVFAGEEGLFAFYDETLFKETEIEKIMSLLAEETCQV